VADAVQHHASDIGVLMDDRPEQVETYVCRWFELLESARARRARQIAAVGRLQIQADRIGRRGLVPLTPDRLEIAAWVDLLFLDACAHAGLRAVSCEMPISPSPSARIAKPLRARPERATDRPTHWRQ